MTVFSPENIFVGFVTNMRYGPHLHLLAGKLLGIEELILHLRSPRGHHIAVLQNRINDLGVIVSLEDL